MAGVPNNHPLRYGPELEFRPTVGESTQPTVLSIDPPTGTIAGGTSVTIKGTNFIVGGDGGGVTVEIDGIPATSVVVIDRRTLTCVTPAGVDVGKVDVEVTTFYGGQSATLFGGFTFWAPTIVSVLPAYGPFSGGTKVIVTGFNFVTGSQILFGSVPATEVIFIDSQHYSCITPPHAQGFVDVEIIEPGP